MKRIALLLSLVMALTVMLPQTPVNAAGEPYKAQAGTFSPAKHQYTNLNTHSLTFSIPSDWISMEPQEEAYLIIADDESVALSVSYQSLEGVVYDFASDTPATDTALASLADVLPERIDLILPTVSLKNGIHITRIFTEECQYALIESKDEFVVLGTIDSEDPTVLLSYQHLIDFIFYSFRPIGKGLASDKPSKPSSPGSDEPAPDVDIPGLAAAEGASGDTCTVNNVTISFDDYSGVETREYYSGFFKMTITNNSDKTVYLKNDPMIYVNNLGFEVSDYFFDYPDSIDAGKSAEMVIRFYEEDAPPIKELLSLEITMVINEKASPFLFSSCKNGKTEFLADALEPASVSVVDECALFVYDCVIDTKYETAELHMALTNLSDKSVVLTHRSFNYLNNISHYSYSMFDDDTVLEPGKSIYYLVRFRTPLVKYMDDVTSFIGIINVNGMPKIFNVNLNA